VTLARSKVQERLRERAMACSEQLWVLRRDANNSISSTLLVLTACTIFSAMVYEAQREAHAQAHTARWMELEMRR